jgi:endonuclease/exonuclease/phosphatase family metal-dependent hydrolase
MRSLRLLTWNCHHGSLSVRLAELASFSPAIIFLQECKPTDPLSLTRPFVTQRVNTTKAIALASLDAAYLLARLRPRAKRGRAVVGATVSGPVSFTVLGIWSQGPRYVDDVMRTLKAYDRVLRSGPAVVMGDLNSGTNLNARQPPSKGHARILTALADVGLVSAYHRFHGVEHGSETHSTYRHQRNPAKPWHIDFCFVPVGWDVVGVEVPDGEEWTTRSDHLPLCVEVRFTQEAKR